VWYYLESRVQPILAGLLAYCDCNANLDLLDSNCAVGDDNYKKLIPDLWMDMLCNANVTQLTYR